MDGYEDVFPHRPTQDGHGLFQALPRPQRAAPFPWAETGVLGLLAAFVGVLLTVGPGLALAIAFSSPAVLLWSVLGGAFALGGGFVLAMIASHLFDRAVQRLQATLAFGDLESQSAAVLLWWMRAHADMVPKDGQWWARAQWRLVPEGAVLSTIALHEHRPPEDGHNTSTRTVWYGYHVCCLADLPPHLGSVPAARIAPHGAVRLWARRHPHLDAPSVESHPFALGSAHTRLPLVLAASAQAGHVLADGAATGTPSMPDRVNRGTA